MSYKVKRGAYKNLNQTELLIFAQKVIDATFENETYKDLTDQVASLKTNAESYDDALTSAMDGGKSATIVKNLAKTAVTNSLDNVADALDFYNGDNLAFITNTGNTVREHSSPKSFEAQMPKTPVNPVVKSTGTRGVIDIYCEIPNREHVLNVAAEWSEDGEVWHNGNYFTPSHSKTVSVCKGEMQGLPSFKEVKVRFRSIGRHDMKSNWTTELVVPVL